MMKWDSRMHNTRSVQVLKVAIPFFDVSEGELIDVEGLLQAIHPLTCGRERKMMDSVMSFFQMRHMMDLFRMMRCRRQMRHPGQKARKIHLKC